MSEHARIIKGDGMGGFLNPPGDPSYTCHVSIFRTPRSVTEIGSMSIDLAAEDPDLPEAVRARAKEIIDNAVRVESGLWIRYIYGYFRGMWTADGARWTNADELLTRRPADAPDEYAAAAVWVRRWFPGHVVRADLLADPGKGYGAYPCVRCGYRVQYEARWDELTRVDTRSLAGTECAKGGPHSVETAPVSQP